MYLRGSDKGVCGWVGVVSAREVPVVAGDN